MTTLERPEFQRLLFRTAFCLMACDGDIDPREVEEIRHLNRTAYFKGLDISAELDELLADVEKRGKRMVEDLFDSLGSLQMNFVQELQLLEVALRLVHADERVDENEIRFLRQLRSRLYVPDSLLLDRFGFIEYLMDKDHARQIETTGTNDWVEKFTLPEFAVLKDLNFTDENSLPN